MKLLIIRPEPGASASAARAKTAGFEPLVLSFFAASARAWVARDPARYDALLLTSANAVRHAGPGLETVRALPAYCVGTNTADAARAAGLAVAFIGGTDADEAVAAAVAGGHGKLIWLAGADHRAITPPPEVHIDTAVVYASQAVPLPSDAKQIIAAADAIALHSPRAAAAFGEAVDRLDLERNRFIIAAFSPVIAAAAGTGWCDIAIADTPSDSAMLSALATRGRDA